MESSKKVLVVFGATGATGKYIVSKALDSGNLHVRVFVRSPDKIPAEIKSHADLEVFQGSMEDLQAIDRALAGAEYIFCAVMNAALSKQSLFMNAAVKQIIESMRKHSVKRFVYQAGAFSPIPGTPNTMTVKILRGIMGGLMGLSPSLKDNDAVIETLWNVKDVEWVVTRPGIIKDEPSKGKLKVSDKVPAGAITFSDLADFSLAAVQSNELKHVAPYLQY